MAIPDYSKIWGANSPLAKYEFTEADYLRGWEFIGSMPPSRTMFDAWMRGADEKMLWLYDNAFSENSLGGFLFWRLPDTAYFVGEKRALQDGPLDVYIECTIAGRTSKEQMKKLPQGAEIGKTFVDGTATWLVRQFVTSAALDDHRKKTPLDHPDGSVLKKHLGFEVYDKGEVYSKNEINQSYRKIGNKIVSGDVDWNTLTEATTYKIHGATMNSAHHAPPNEYNFGLLVVNRLENGADGEWRTVQIYFPHSTRGYWSRMYNNGHSDYRAEGWLPWVYIPTHDELNVIAEQKASTKVSKNGDTMTGQLTFVTNTDGIKGYVANNEDHWRLWGKNSHPEVALDIWSYGNRKPSMFFRRFINDQLTEQVNLIDDNGNASFPKDLTAFSIYTNDWFRVNSENKGIHWQKYGGGWHMTDKEWIRAWGGKSIYTSGKMKADAGFEGNLRGTADNANIAQHVNNEYKNMRFHWSGKDGQPTWLWGSNDGEHIHVWNPANFRVANANTVGDKSLQWILEQINAAKTGIVAGNLEPNGWVKFTNGLIVQWTRCTESKNETDFRYFPMKFPKTLFYICASSTHANNWLGVSWTRKVDNEKFVCGLGYDYVVDNTASMFILAFGA